MNEEELIVMENPDRICPGKMEVPTPKEQEALAGMKSIKERVREMKKRLAALEDSGRGQDADEMQRLEKELDRLKAEWDQWEEKRKAAAKERMIILGHEEGDI